MATFENRSRIYVHVKGRADLSKEYPYDQPLEAQAYLQQLRTQGFTPKLEQYEDKILVRIRTKGFKAQQFTTGSLKEAEGSAAKIEEEQSRGLFIDYTKSHSVTVAELIERYIKEECGKHKGKAIEKYKLRAMVADSTGELKRKLALDAERDNKDLPVWASGRQRPKRQPISSLEWLQKPFALVEATDIEDFIRDRVDVVKPGTVDRELDLLSAVIRVAINTWGYNVACNPMLGVRRPRYFNERDQRLKGDMEVRLLEAARSEDRIRSRALEVERQMAPGRKEARALPGKPAQKRYLAEARKQAELQSDEGYPHVALYETLISFLLATAARRGEALNLLYVHVDYDEQTAFLPETKNGRPRKLPLIRTIVQALRELPNDEERVFPISVDELKNAWVRICARAGIKDLHIHDLRHEAISRVADTGKFSLIDLQAYSGHLDPRSLLRYAHLCAKQLAKRLEVALEKGAMTYQHKGRARLRKGANMSIGELVRDSGQTDRALEHMRMAVVELERGGAQALPAEQGQESKSGADALPGNVVQFVPRLRKQAM